jgi:hypothetical protein
MLKCLLPLFLSVAGCATPAPLKLSLDHPANPDAPAGAPLAISNVLAPSTMPATTPSTQPTQQGGPHHAH